MKRVVICIIALTLVLRAFAQGPLLGLTEAELLAAKGAPIAKTVRGNKAIYRWNDMEVGLSDGKVVNVTLRNQRQEEALRAHSEMRSTVEKEKAQAERQRIENEALDARRRSGGGQAAGIPIIRVRDNADWQHKENQSKLLTAQIESARQEVNRLKGEIRRDYLAGLNTLNKRIALSTKEREMQALINSRNGVR